MAEATGNEVEQGDMNPKDTEKLGRVVMCLIGGLFCIGRMEGGGPKLYKPRIFNIFEEQDKDVDGNFIWLDKAGNKTKIETGVPSMKEMIGMRPFPGVPPFVYIPKDSLYYPVTTNTQNILALYNQVTQPPPKVVLPHAPKLVDAHGRKLM